MAGFLALTGHWIGEDSENRLHLRSALLGFTRLSGHHDGAMLAETVLGLLDRVGATYKVCLFNITSYEFFNELEPLGRTLFYGQCFKQRNAHAKIGGLVGRTGHRIRCTRPPNKVLPTHNSYLCEARHG